jgi:5-methylcytosine-specific restriction endonuclease McrA
VGCHDFCFVHIFATLEEAMAKMWWQYRKEGKARNSTDYDRGESVNTYYHRDELLKKLGYQSYAQYLTSELWKQIREKVLQEKGQTCTLCSSKATVIHHNSYCEKALTGEYLTQMFPLCFKCHHIIEHTSDGKKRTRFLDVKIQFNKKYGQMKKRKKESI